MLFCRQMELPLWGQTHCRTGRHCCLQEPGSSSRSCQVNHEALLIQVLHEAPSLPEHLSQDSKRALSATSTALRRHMHVLANSISLDNEDDLKLLFSTGVGPWLQTLDLTRVKLTASIIPGLTSAPWSALTSVNLSNTGLNSTMIRKLALADWPLLQQLDVSNNKLSTAAIKAMAANNWPHLDSLNLSANSLNTASITELARAGWSGLQSLNLGSSHNLRRVSGLSSSWCWDSGHF